MPLSGDSRVLRTPLTRRAIRDREDRLFEDSGGIPLLSLGGMELTRFVSPSL